MAESEVLGTAVPTSRHERYWPALDGLRAIAVVIVIAFHAKFRWFERGDIGVDIFFALSGFLITTVLVEEWDRRARIGLGRFYLRRILRLYPALLLMVAGCFVIAAVLGQSILDDTVRALPAAVTYWSNWWAVSEPSGLFGHLWSLSVEEQFYLVWPLLLIIGLRFGKRVALICTLALVAVFVVVIAILSTLWSPERLYLGTDARAPQLLIGAAAALAFSMRRPTRLRTAIRVAAAAAALYLAAVTVGVFGNHSLPQMLTIAVAATAVVVCLTDPPEWCAKILGSKPALGLGRISYGVYLWQIPLGAIVVVELRSPPPIVWFALVLPGSIVMAWLSYRLVEVRCLRLKRKLA